MSWSKSNLSKRVRYHHAGKAWQLKRIISMFGLFGPPKAHINAHDFINQQLDQIFSQQCQSQEFISYIDISKEIQNIKETEFDTYLDERRFAFTTLLELAWIRNISQQMFLKYSELVADDKRVKSIHHDSYYQLLSSAQQSGYKTFDYMAGVFMTRIFNPNNNQLSQPHAAILLPFYSNNFETHFLNYEKLVKKYKII